MAEGKAHMGSGKFRLRYPESLIVSLLQAAKDLAEAK